MEQEDTDTTPVVAATPQVTIAIRASNALRQNRALALTLSRSKCYSCGEAVLMKQDVLTTVVREGRPFVCEQCMYALIEIKKMDSTLRCQVSKEERRELLWSG